MITFAEIKFLLTIISFLMILVYFVYFAMMNRKLKIKYDNFMFRPTFHTPTVPDPDFIGMSVYSNLNRKRDGQECYCCGKKIESYKEPTEYTSPRFWEWIMSDDSLTLCKVCHREENLNLLISGSNLLVKFQKFALSKFSTKVTLSAVFLVLPFSIAAIFVANKTFSDVCSLSTSIMLIIHWSIQIYQVYLCRK